MKISELPIIFTSKIGKTLRFYRMRTRPKILLQTQLALDSFEKTRYLSAICKVTLPPADISMWLVRKTKNCCCFSSIYRMRRSGNGKSLRASGKANYPICLLRTLVDLSTGREARRKKRRFSLARVTKNARDAAMR